LDRKRTIRFLQLAATALVFASLFRLVDPTQLMLNLKRAPWWSVPAGLASMTVVLSIAALRWNTLLMAYGASARPPVARLFQLHVIGMLYNMLPGSVGGDVLRGIVTRTAFTEGRATTGLAIVLVERLVGLAGLILLACSMLVVRPIAGIQIAWTLALLGLIASAGAILTIALSHRLAHYLPGRLADIARSLPPIVQARWLFVAVLWSVVSQALVGITAHVFIVGLDPSVALADSLTLAPMAFAATYFPLTVGGAGTRDAAMVALYGTVGVSQPDALAASIQILLAYIIYAGIGGWVSLRSAVGRELAEAVRNTGEKAANG